jgi:release factor glutamine methyltransferase
MPTIKDWLYDANNQLSRVGISSAKLDSEIIFAYVLGKNRTYLHAHFNQIIDKRVVRGANAQLQKRLNHIPIAYITGFKEFYGREFIVSPEVLIPRPESEDIIEILKQILPSTTYHLSPTKLVDVGTGCGCLGITAKLEFPFIEVCLTDNSKSALIIAKQNAKKFKIIVNYHHGNLLEKFAEIPDIIIANLPYVDSSWERSPETDFEPKAAIFADNNGLSYNQRLIDQASNKLKVGGYLLIEADPEQHSHLCEYANKRAFRLESIVNYIICFIKL